MQARELRRRYLEFFESKGALRLPSDSLVADDPTLMFTVAGMVPFKAYFEDRATPPRTSVTTAQKCLRTKDIEDIGDISHCTFFEMLGNFSFGDYFKREAVTWAWEFLTRVVEIAPHDLRVTVFQDDDEAFALWTECGLPPERITRLGEKTNYWPANALAEKSPGPCGPCSEIFFDLQPDQPFDTDWNGEGSRWLEIWNLVFTQFTGEGEGDNYRLVALPKKNIDTGSGLERTAAAINRLSGPFETDLLRPIIAKLEVLSGKTYTATPDSATDIAFRRIADHARATTFLLADGVTPDRSGRGYVLRRLMRRAIVAGIRRLGFADGDGFLHHVVPTVAEIMSDQYPELGERMTYLLEAVRGEETLFRRTLQNGLGRLDDALAEGGGLSGERAFDLYETYGLPFEITREIAAERGVEVDETEYRQAEETARKISRTAAGKIDVWAGSNAALGDLLKSLPATRFVGYGELTHAGATVVGLVVDGAPVDRLETGQTADLLLDVTPFYAESGGQVGDAGRLTGTNGAVFTVADTRKQNGLYFHRGIADAPLAVGDTVTANVHAERRGDIARNHTATHLLHKALRDRLGSHVQQRGSLVAPDRLRFDFAHGQALTDGDMRQVEAEVNAALLAGLPVQIDEKPIAQAREMGAMMLFGEKYGDVVRVVSVGGDYSREFCGGTHVGNAAQIGSFRLVSEGSAAAGVRRIEAVTGRGADAYDTANRERLAAVAALLGVTAAQAPEAAERLQAEVKALKAQLTQAQRSAAGSQAAGLVEAAKMVGGVPVVVASVEADDGAALSALADDVLGRLPGGVVVLASATGGKVLFVAKASKDAVGRGAHAGNVIKAAATVAGGGGGGKPDFAQAGGRDTSKLPDALDAAQATLAAQLGKG